MDEHTLTKFEAAEVVATRASLLSRGAAVRLSDEEVRRYCTGGGEDVVRLACAELYLRRLDARIVRTVGNRETHVSVQSAALPDSVGHLLGV